MRHVVLIVKNSSKSKKNKHKIKKYKTFITENGEYEHSLKKTFLVCFAVWVSSSLAVSEDV